MKLKPSKYAQLIAAFIIFTGLVFVAFATFRNSSAVASGNNMLVYFSLFLVLIAGAFLFNLANKNISRDTSGNEDLPAETKNQEHPDSDHQEGGSTAKSFSPEEEFDPKALLPKEKNNPALFSEELLRNMADKFRFVQALFYARRPGDEIFSCIGQFAYYSETRPADFRSGETLPGQAVKNKNIVTLSNLPDHYMTVASGLGKSSPGYLTFVPVKHNDEVLGLIEFASFSPLTDAGHQQLLQVSEKTGEIIVKLLKK